MEVMSYGIAFHCNQIYGWWSDLITRLRNSYLTYYIDLINNFICLRSRMREEIRVLIILYLIQKFLGWWKRSWMKYLCCSLTFETLHSKGRSHPNVRLYYHEQRLSRVFSLLKLNGGKSISDVGMRLSLWGVYWTFIWITDLHIRDHEELFWFVYINGFII